MCALGYVCLRLPGFMFVYDVVQGGNWNKTGSMSRVKWEGRTTGIRGNGHCRRSLR